MCLFNVDWILRCSHHQETKLMSENKSSFFLNDIVQPRDKRNFIIKLLEIVAEDSNFHVVMIKELF